MKTKRLGSLAAAVLAAGLVLTGCQQDPGTAAQVGDATISTADVDLLSDAMCEEREDLAEQGHSAAAPRAVARDEALLSLIRVEVGREFAEGKDLSIDTRAVNELSTQVEENVSTVDEADRPRLRELVRSLLVEQQQMMAIAKGSFEEQGQQAPQDLGQMIEAGRTIVLESDDVPEVEVNPRFASPQLEQFGTAGSALSEPVSKTARAASGEAETAVEALPVNLRCG